MLYQHSLLVCEIKPLHHTHSHRLSLASTPCHCALFVAGGLAAVLKEAHGQQPCDETAPMALAICRSSSKMACQEMSLINARARTSVVAGVQPGDSMKVCGAAAQQGPEVEHSTRPCRNCCPAHHLAQH